LAVSVRRHEVPRVAADRGGGEVEGARLGMPELVWTPPFGAGQIWYSALTGGQVTADTDFAGFAAATVAAAGDHADAVRQAWSAVGVDAGGSSGGGTSSSGAPVGVVRVRRTGGIAGRTVEGCVDLASGDDRATNVRDLVDRLDLSGPEDSAPMPDAFSYTFEVCDRSVTVPQHRLNPDQRALADLVLGAG
jgi:hypothetical protein